ncbi:MAG TPA: DNA-binding protein [Bacteroidetes bacterium]|nr:DNA-binding protein [Bacteroidota bacterium]HIL56831.1 DNA-binding protein [Rhodothermales bacterium]
MSSEEDHPDRSQIAHEGVEAGGHRVDAQGFRSRLLAWGRDHVRSFPWRETDEPYRLLMAEVMLHRTQVRQVLPVYERFIVLFPDVAALARASRESVHAVMGPLGLHWRIDLVADMAADLVGRFGGRVPSDREALLSLPGVSDYIASAVRCFSFGLDDALVDTNTVRIVGRVFGLPTKPSSRRNRRFRDLHVALLDRERPADYNYSLLDLGHLVCLSRRAPECERCPLLASCATGAARLAVTA